MSEEKGIVKDDEIDLVELARTIWSRRGLIIKVTGIFFLIGLVIAFTSKVEYEASAKLLPETQEQALPDLGGLGGLAGLAGFDLSSFGGGGQVLSPELFPEIVRSEPFLETLINTPVYFESFNTTVSSFYFLKEMDSPSLLGLLGEFTIGLPGKIKGLFVKDQVTLKNHGDLKRYSKDDWEIFEDFSNRIDVVVRSSSGIIQVKVEIPDPTAAAEVAKVMLDLLTQYIVDYKIEKATINLEFVQGQFEKARIEYQEKQAHVARFTDANRNLTNALIQLEYKRLQNEMEIAFEVYKGLATQLEQAKIKVNQEMPAFTVLEPVRIPEDNSKPKRGLVVIGFTILGFLLTLTYCFFLQLYRYNVSK